LTPMGPVALCRSVGWLWLVRRTEGDPQPAGARVLARAKRRATGDRLEEQRQALLAVEDEAPGCKLAKSI
jgi:hypothetical protein